MPAGVVYCPQEYNPRSGIVTLQYELLTADRGIIDGRGLCLTDVREVGRTWPKPGQIQGQFGELVPD
ncbi:MAG: hypothetical protein AAGL89_16040, partial [Pseudomonadota bacterium]